MFNSLQVSRRTKSRLIGGALAAATVAATLALSPVGNSGATSHTVVVKPSSLNGWGVVDDNGNGGGSVSFVGGPAVPPVGSGSGQLQLSAANAGWALASLSAIPPSTPLAALTALSYDTYRSSVDAGNNLAVALQIPIDFDVTDASSAYQGRLVFEPYLTTGVGGTVTQNTWRHWDALAGRWWQTGSGTFPPVVGGVVQTGPRPCLQATPCTLATLLLTYPNAGVHPYALSNPTAPPPFYGHGSLWLKAGSGWAVFNGNVDNLTVGFGANTTTYNFEPEIACTTTCYVDAATGNDSFGGDTSATAKKTIQGGINAVNVGGTVVVASGTYNEDVAVNKTVTLLGAGAGSTSVVGPIGGAVSTFQVAAPAVVIDGFTITRAGNNVSDWNLALNSAGVAIQSQGNYAEIRNNVITGNRTGIDINNSNGNSVHNNAIDNNRTGMIFRNQTDNTSVTMNSVAGNWTVGILFLDASGGSNSPVQTAANSTFNRNDLSGNWYGHVVDRQAGGSLPAPGANLKNFECNWYGTVSPVVSVLNSAEPSYSGQIPVAYGGTAVAPGNQPDILGAASANIDYVPFLVSNDLNGTCAPIGQGAQPLPASGNEGGTLYANGSFTGTGITVTQTSAPLGLFVDNGGGSWSWSYATTDQVLLTTVEVTGEDAYGNQLTQTFTVDAVNVEPTATFNAPTSVNESASFNISLDDPIDPSSVDAAVLTYAFDCGAGFGSFGPSPSASCTAPLGGTITVQGTVMDKDGAFTTYSQPVSVLSGLTQKQAVLAALQGLVPTGDSKTDKLIKDAVKDMTKAVAPALWIDGSHPSRNKTFNEEKNAIKHLMGIKNPSPAVLSAINSIWNIDRVLAETAIAEAAGGNAVTLAKAADEMAKAAVAVANGDFDKAINHYRNAWKAATEA